MKNFAGCLCLFISFLSCNQTRNEPAAIAPPANSSTSSQRAVNPSPSNAAVSGLSGEWEQAFCVIDQNSNAVLDEQERNGEKINGGFDYFKFNADGSCLRDRDIQFSGTYEITEKNGKSKLHIHTDPPGETYRYTIITTSRDELILFADGVFMVFKRIG